LSAPLKQQTWAKCKDGTLYVNNQQGAGFEPDDMGTYHELDYALFYMNIHNNAKQRSNSYLSQ
jgi:hypothetical protein